MEDKIPEDVERFYKEALKNAEEALAARRRNSYVHVASFGDYYSPKRTPIFNKIAQGVVDRLKADGFKANYESKVSHYQAGMTCTTRMIITM